MRDKLYWDVFESGRGYAFEVLNRHGEPVAEGNGYPDPEAAKEAARKQVTRILRERANDQK